MVSSQLRQIYSANFFLFASVFLLFPIVPVEMAYRLDITLTHAGFLFISIMAGRIMAGPFVNYLIDAFKRKYLCITSLTIILVATAVYMVTENQYTAYLLAFLQGICFGVVSSSLITISIDITPSEFRNKANLTLAWSTRLGMLLGIASGSFIYLNSGFLFTLYASFICGLFSLLFLLLLKIPFRAPIGPSLVSLDRFLLPKGWVIMINLIMISFVAGVFMPVFHYNVATVFIIYGFTIPYFVFILIGFLLTFYLKKLINKSKEKMVALTALLLLVVSVAIFILLNNIVGLILSGILSGLAFGLITPVFLMMFVELSSHCERDSANSTNLLSWGIGLTGGLFVSCYLKDNYSSLSAYQFAMFFSSVALLYFVFFTNPYYNKQKLR